MENLDDLVANLAESSVQDPFLLNRVLITLTEEIKKLKQENNELKLSITAMSPYVSEDERLVAQTELMQINKLKESSEENRRQFL